MKKSFAIVLLLLFSLIAVHPALMLHYCGGNLASVSCINTQEPLCCCSESNDAPLTDTNQSASFSAPSCCNNIHLSLSTDDYQSHSEINLPQQSTLKILAPACNNLMCLLAPSLQTQNQPASPPNHPPIAEDKLLQLFCTYRI